MLAPVPRSPAKQRIPRRVAALVRERIERGGERLWRFEDFADLPFSTVAKALSRLARAGVVERVSKGTYYRSRATPFGASRPSDAALRELASRSRSMFPSGLAAASVLGFTTQAPARPEVSTESSNLPRKLVGDAMVVRTRRPAAWAGLNETDAALLDFLRQVGRNSELSARDTVLRTLELLEERGRFRRLAQIAATEPPRVRALLGALGEQLGRNPRELRVLKRSLNPLSRFDFGVFRALAKARAWQAKE
jgi:hypothetical protein